MAKVKTSKLRLEDRVRMKSSVQRSDTTYYHSITVKIEIKKMCVWPLKKTNFDNKGLPKSYGLSLKDK